MINLKQKEDETVVDFIERFRKLSRRFTKQLLETKYTAIILGNMPPHMKEVLLNFP